MLAIQDTQFFNAQLTKLEKFSETIKKLHSEDPNVQEYFINPLLDILCSDTELFNPDVIRERLQSEEIQTRILRITRKEHNIEKSLFSVMISLFRDHDDKKAITKKMEDMLRKKDKYNFQPNSSNLEVLFGLEMYRIYINAFKHTEILIKYLTIYYKHIIKGINPFDPIQKDPENYQGKSEENADLKKSSEELSLHNQDTKKLIIEISLTQNQDMNLWEKFVSLLRQMILNLANKFGIKVAIQEQQQSKEVQTNIQTLGQNTGQEQGKGLQL